MAPRPLGQDLLIQQVPGELEHQLVHLCQLPCQPQGLLQLQQVVHEQFQSETKENYSLKSNDLPKLSINLSVKDYPFLLFSHTTYIILVLSSKQEMGFPFVAQHVKNLLTGLRIQHCCQLQCT